MPTNSNSRDNCSHSYFSWKINFRKDHSDSNAIEFFYISLIAIVVSIPGEYRVQSKLSSGLQMSICLPICTPILAYAGIAIGRSWADFKKLGWKSVVVGNMCSSLEHFLWFCSDCRNCPSLAGDYLMYGRL